MATYSPVACSEEMGTIQEDPSIDGFKCSVTLRCDWGDRHALVSDLLLNARAWPHVSEIVAPRAKSCSIRAEGLPGTDPENGQAIDHRDALVTVNYSQTHQQEEASEGNIKIYSEEIEPTIEFLTLDHRDFRWGTAGGDVLLEAEAPGKILRGFNYVKTFYFVLNPPAVLLSLMGSTNAAPLASGLLPFTFAAETLLYTPPHISRSISTTDGQAWTVRLSFSYKAEGWNKFWRSQSQQYEKIVVYKTDTEYKNYPLADFSIFVNLGI